MSMQARIATAAVLTLGGAALHKRGEHFGAVLLLWLAAAAGIGLVLGRWPACSWPLSRGP